MAQKPPKPEPRIEVIYETTREADYINTELDPKVFRISHATFDPTAGPNSLNATSSQDIDDGDSERGLLNELVSLFHDSKRRFAVIDFPKPDIFRTSSLKFQKDSDYMDTEITFPPEAGRTCVNYEVIDTQENTMIGNAQLYIVKNSGVTQVFLRGHLDKGPAGSNASIEGPETRTRITFNAKALWIPKGTQLRPQLVPLDISPSPLSYQDSNAGFDDRSYPNGISPLSAPGIINTIHRPEIVTHLVKRLTGKVPPERAIPVTVTLEPKSRWRSLVQVNFCQASPYVIPPVGQKTMVLYRIFTVAKGPRDETAYCTGMAHLCVWRQDKQTQFQLWGHVNYKLPSVDAADGYKPMMHWFTETYTT